MYLKFIKYSLNAPKANKALSDSTKTLTIKHYAVAVKIWNQCST